MCATHNKLAITMFQVRRNKSQSTYHPSTLAVSLHLLLLALVCCLHLCYAAIPSGFHTGTAVRLTSAQERLTPEQQPFTTTTVMPTSSIEDPSNSDTSEASAASSSSDANDDNYCFSCYEKLKQAKQLIAIQLNLVNTINKLVRQKNKALVSSHNSTSAYRPKRNQRNSNNNNASNMTRSLMNHLSSSSETTNKPTSVLVSTLRVARAASLDNQPSYDSSRRTNSSKITKDPILKQLGHKKEQQLVETCKMIYDVQNCLNDLSGECLGNLQYHSQDVYIRQWFGKLDCRRTNTTRGGWFAGLTRSLPIVEEQEKVPRARNNSSDEKVNERISDLLGSRSLRPFAVELKPHGYRLAPQYHPLSLDPNDPNNENYFRD